MFYNESYFNLRFFRWRGHKYERFTIADILQLDCISLGCSMSVPQLVPHCRIEWFHITEQHSRTSGIFFNVPPIVRRANLDRNMDFTLGFSACFALSKKVP